MTQTATITGKMQFTIPISFARKLGLAKGQKVIVSQQGSGLLIQPMQQVLANLAGSLSVPKSWEGKNIDVIISEAKKDYFSKKA